MQQRQISYMKETSERPFPDEETETMKPNAAKNSKASLATERASTECGKKLKSKFGT